MTSLSDGIGNVEGYTMVAKMGCSEGVSFGDNVKTCTKWFAYKNN